jgi:hypothetical protein
MAVVDQIRGPTTPVEWLEFAHLSLGGSENTVAACWLFEGRRIGAGIHVPGLKMALATPGGWTYEGSLSANFRFVENGEIQETVRFLRHEDGVDVYLDLSCAKEVYLARANGKQRA